MLRIVWGKTIGVGGWGSHLEKQIRVGAVNRLDNNKQTQTHTHTHTHTHMKKQTTNKKGEPFFVARAPFTNTLY